LVQWLKIEGHSVIAHNNELKIRRLLGRKNDVIRQYGNMASGDMHYMLTIEDSEQWADDPGKPAYQVKLDPNNTLWKRLLFNFCLDVGLASLDDGWNYDPQWFLVSYYG
jgi:hypothetical protein